MLVALVTNTCLSLPVAQVSVIVVLPLVLPFQLLRKPSVCICIAIEAFEVFWFFA